MIIEEQMKKYRDGLSIDKDGNKWWHKDLQLHRDNGPAIEWACGAKHWYVNGVRHRLDGPAYEDPNGKSCWYLNGLAMSEKEFKERLKENK